MLIRLNVDFGLKQKCQISAENFCSRNFGRTLIKVDQILESTSTFNFTKYNSL